MENLKSLADQLREEMGKPATKKGSKRIKKSTSGSLKETNAHPDLVERIKSFDNSQFKSMVHIRFDQKTLDLMNRLKLAAGIDVTKLVAFSVHNLFEAHPELKQTIKNYLQNLEL